MSETRQKRVRTCVGCGTQSTKADLMRLVRTADGVQFDASGRKPGRGAYVCSEACLDKAFSTRKLQRALKCGVERSEVDQVIAEIKTALAR